MVSGPRETGQDTVVLRDGMQRDAEGVDRGARAMFWQEECVVTEAYASGRHVFMSVILFPVILFPQVNACGQLERYRRVAVYESVSILRRLRP